MIRYIVGDATRPEGDGRKVIAHVCNDIGAWGGGFTGALSRRWGMPERVYRSWRPYELGTVCFVRVPEGVAPAWVANIIGQHGTIGRDNPSPIRYDAIATGLREVARFCTRHGASVHMPRIGCGLAGGQWDRVEPIVMAALEGIDVTVYDLPGA